MDKIMCQVHTNLDRYKRKIWPSEVCCKPAVGEYMESDVGDRLKIYSIIHTVDYRSGMPMLRIELVG